MAVTKIDIAKEFAESQRVETLANAMHCPNCTAPQLHAFHVGLTASWEGIYAPGCPDCGYIEGYASRDTRNINPGSTKGT